MASGTTNPRSLRSAERIPMDPLGGFKPDSSRWGNMPEACPYRKGGGGRRFIRIIRFII